MVNLQKRLCGFSVICQLFKEVLFQANQQPDSFSPLEWPFKMIVCLA